MHVHTECLWWITVSTHTSKYLKITHTHTHTNAIKQRWSNQPYLLRSTVTSWQGPADSDKDILTKTSPQGPMTSILTWTNQQGHTTRTYRQGPTHTPSITFWQLPPNSGRIGYTTEGSLFISAQLSTNGQHPPKGLGTNKTVKAT